MKPYTVIFFIDGDYAVESFVERVWAESSSTAWDVAVAQAKQHGCTSTGRTLHESDYENATEILTIDGHHEASHG